MKPRGFSIIEIIGVIVALVALVGAVAGLVHIVTTEMENIDRKGFDRGVQTTDAAYKARDNAKLLAAAQRIQQLEEQARGEEDRQQKAIDVAVAQHFKEKRDVENKLEVLRAAVRDGSLQLRDPGGSESGAGCPGSGERAGSKVADDSTGSVGHNGGGIFSAEASEFLLTEAARADRKVIALQLCRATLRAERPTP